MRYQVPQFIEVEDKIFGPFTLKQFLYIAGGLAIAFLIWRMMPIKFLAIIIDIPIIIFFVTLAIKQDFVKTVENSLKYFLSGKLYIWKKAEKMPISKKDAENKTSTSNIYVPKLSDSKLRDLTWGLDINENLANQQMQEKYNREQN